VQITTRPNEIRLTHQHSAARRHLAEFRFFIASSATENGFVAQTYTFIPACGTRSGDVRPDWQIPQIKPRSIMPIRGLSARREAGHLLDEAKTMARDLVASAERQSFKISVVITKAPWERLT
jgi:hypothetical protein